MPCYSKAPETISPPTRRPAWIGEYACCKYQTRLRPATPLARFAPSAMQAPAVARPCICTAVAPFARVSQSRLSGPCPGNILRNNQLPSPAATTLRHAGCPCRFWAYHTLGGAEPVKLAILTQYY